MSSSGLRKSLLISSERTGLFLNFSIILILFVYLIPIIVHTCGLCNFKTPSQVVPEKSLTEKKLQTRKYCYRKGKNYIIDKKALRRDCNGK